MSQCPENSWHGAISCVSVWMGARRLWVRGCCGCVGACVRGVQKPENILLIGFFHRTPPVEALAVHGTSTCNSNMLHATAVQCVRRSKQRHSVSLRVAAHYWDTSSTASGVRLAIVNCNSSRPQPSYQVTNLALMMDIWPGQSAMTLLTRTVAPSSM